VIRLAVRVHRAQSDIVLAELLELAPAGVEEVDVSDRMVEFAVYGSPGELPSLPDLNALAGDALIEISTSHTSDDWQERWKQFHRPVTIEPPSPNRSRRALPALRIRPPWEPAHAPAGAGNSEEIVIDPGQAFGTGAHASTRLCLELLLALAGLARQPALLVDVGTGSGVLAIAAARLGFAPVVALDHERESVAAARENAAANDVLVDVRHFDLRTEPLPPAGADMRTAVVIANLLKPLLLELAGTIPQRPEHLIAGGLLVEEVDQIVDAFGVRLGMRERERRESGGWAAVWLVASEM
jgi:ribosomal protein L11 methyltransferase